MPTVATRFDAICHCYCHQTYESNINGRRVHMAIWASIGEMWKYAARPLTDIEIEHVIRVAAKDGDGDISEAYIMACIKVTPKVLSQNYLSLREFEEDVRLLLT